MTYGCRTFRKTLVAFVPPGGTNIWSGPWTKGTLPWQPPFAFRWAITSVVW